jgi:hypothetical protein
MAQARITKRYQRFGCNGDLLAFFDNDNCGHNTAFIAICGGNLTELDPNKR